MMYDAMKRAIEQAEKALKDVTVEGERLRQAATGASSKIMPVNSLRLEWNFQVKTNSWKQDEILVEPTIANATRSLDEAWQKVEAKHAENAAAIENNRAIRQTVQALMTAIGIPEVYDVYDYPTERSRTKKTIKKTAGWRQDLAHFCRSDDGYDAARQAYEAGKKKIEEWSREQRAKEQEKQAIAAAEAKKAEGEKLRAVMAVKYGLDFKTDMYDVLMAILGRNKYLHLAYWLERNRLDWNDGTHYARRGLDNFSVESVTDRAIYDEIQSHIVDWDGDGRVFRDCKYNYSTLYEMVEDGSLVADFNAVREHVQEY